MSANLVGGKLTPGSSVEVMMAGTLTSPSPGWEKRAVLVEQVAEEEGREYYFTCEGVVASDEPPGATLDLTITSLSRASWRRVEMKSHFRATLELRAQFAEHIPDPKLTDRAWDP
jgi:hypothetical protein